MTHFKTPATHDEGALSRGWRAARRARHRQAWEMGVTLANEVYACTAAFPEADERVLAKCMRQAALAVPGCVAAGSSSGTEREELQSLLTAHGALKELETYCVVASELGFLAAAECAELRAHIAAVGEVLRGFIDHLTRHMGRAREDRRVPVLNSSGFDS
jgi:four helix bundle protein